MTKEVDEAISKALNAADGFGDLPDGQDRPDIIAFRRALAEQGYAVEQDWQPIETAPRDGRFVLLHVPRGLESGTVTVGAYWKHDDRDDNGRFRKGNWEGWLGMDVDIASSWCDPTHWRPLPATPGAMIRAAEG